MASSLVHDEVGDKDVQSLSDQESVRSITPPSSSFYLHQIWLQGEDKLPSKYKESVEKYRAMTSGYRLWSYGQLLKLFKEKEYRWLLPTLESYEHWIMIVDLAKYVILHKYGGFYIDMDTVPHSSFENLTNEKSRVVIEHVTDDAILKHFQGICTFVNNHFFWVPYNHHPFMKKVLDLASKLSDRMFYELKVWYILDSTGPNLISLAINENPNLIVLQSSEKLRPYFTHDNHRTWLSFDKHDGMLMIVGLLFAWLLIKAMTWKGTAVRR